MQFQFQPQYMPSKMLQSKGLQQIIIQLDNRSERSGTIGFDNFGQQDLSIQGNNSFVSQLYNKPIHESIPQSKQKPQSISDQSRNINQISYLMDGNQSFRFQNSVSFIQEQKNQRFQKLKALLNKAKTNNLQAFYRNIQQTGQQANNQGNKQFKDKSQFKDFTRNMKIQKRQAEIKFNRELQQRKKASSNQPKNVKASLFGAQAADVFKKKNTYDQPFLPAQYLEDDQPQIYLNKFGKQQPSQKNDFLIKQAVQFFGPTTNPPSHIRPSKNLTPIREQIYTVLDQSIQQRKLQQLMNNYKGMKGNYNSLMQQLKQTSQGQYKLMDQMQKIKTQYRQGQAKLKQTPQDLQHKKQQKQKAKQIKQQQLAQIKNQIHQIKANTNEKDLAYLKINQKIQGLQKIVRMALQQVQQQKIQKQHFMPKVINYYKTQQNSQRNSQKQQSQPSLSHQSSHLYQIPMNLPSNKILRQQKSPKNNEKHSKHLKNEKPSTPSQSLKRQTHQRSQQQLTFIDDFSSPLQLDLSIRQQQVQNQIREINFNTESFAVEYIPLKIDQTDNKNLRNILTQKSSVIYQSFQFLITVRYTMQDDEVYPIIGNVRIANKCAIDLLDVFVILYGPQGQNIQVTPSKIFQDRLKYGSNIFFQLKIDKSCIEDNGFNMQVCYKTDSITKKKINIKGLLPITQLIQPQFCYQQNFTQTWRLLHNQIFIHPSKLSSKSIRNHQDIKLILPFIQIQQNDQFTFCYGLMFKYPKTKTIFMIMIRCYINGMASVHLRADRNGDHRLKEELLNVISYLLFN